MAETNKTFQHTVDAKFHGDTFRVDISTLGGESLVIEVEEKITGERWRGHFKASYIEEITQKTGNFKKFPVFVKMLVTGLTSTSDSVSLDLLGFEDLERLKQQQVGTSSRTAEDATFKEKEARLKNKRYLILTYLVEFDRVHYPLPLSYVEHFDEVESISSSRRKKEQEYRSAFNSSYRSSSGDGPIVSDIMRNIRAETDALRTKYQDAPVVNEKAIPNEVDNLHADKKKLEEQVEMLTQTVTAQARELESLRKRAEKPIDNHRDEEIKILKNALMQLEEDVQRMEIEHKQELKKKDKKIQLLLEEAEKLQASEQLWRERCRELETVKQRVTTKTPVKKITRSPRTPSARTPTTPRNRFDPTAERKQKLEEARGRSGSGTRSRSNSRTNSIERPRAPSVERNIKSNSRSSSKERSNAGNRKPVSIGSAKKFVPLPPKTPKLRDEVELEFPIKSSKQKTMRILEDSQDDDHWTQKPLSKLSSGSYRRSNTEERLSRLGIRSIEDSPREQKYSDLSESDSDYRNKVPKILNINLKENNFYGKDNGETISEKLNSLQNYLSRRKRGL